MAKEGSGLGKKILIGLAIIALVAIIVVVILLCIPPNTYNAVETLDRTTNNMFLSKEKEKSDLKILKDNVTTASLNSYTQELEDYSTIRDSIYGVLKYFDDNLVFAQNNKNFKKKYKAIKNSLNDSQESRDRLDNILADAKGETKNDHVRNIVIDLRKEYITWVKCNQNAIKSLSQAYNGSMGNTLNNNLASSTIFDVVCDYLSVIATQLQDMSKVDNRGIPVEQFTGVYKNNIHTNAQLLKTFQAKLETDVDSYYFEYAKEGTNNPYEKFAEFKKLYGLNNVQSIIETSTGESGGYKFTKTFEGVEDNDGLYDAAKKFLLGGKE